MKPTIHHRLAVATASLAPLRALLVPLGERERYEGDGPVGPNRWGLRGVPARLVDLWVADPFPEPAVVVELGVKPGRYDGRERDRIQLTTPGSNGHQASPGYLVIQATESEIALFAGIPPAFAWNVAYPRKPHAELGAYDVRCVIWWHYRRWFRMLPWAEVRELATAFELYFTAHPELRVSLDLNGANRMASRWLYPLAISLGWRKLAAYQVEELGLDPAAGPWYPAHQVDYARARDGSISGAGEYSIRTAHGVYHDDDFEE